MAAEVIAIASDHAGVEVKSVLIDDIVAAGLGVIDLGTHGQESVDYPDFADTLAVEIYSGRAGRGVLICGTGIGMSMAANRKSFIRAALCHGTTEARLARQHNNASGRARRCLPKHGRRQCHETDAEGCRYNRRALPPVP